MEKHRFAVRVTGLAGVLVTVAFLVAQQSAGRMGAHEPVRLTAPSKLPVTTRTRAPNTNPHEFDLSMLVPQRARVRQVWFIHGGSRPEQILVEWIRNASPAIFAQDIPDSIPWGLTLWTPSRRKDADDQVRWIGVALPLLKVSPAVENLRVVTADVTGDGHPDVLVEQYPHTNHGCGPHEVVATMPDRTSWRIFHTSLCETTLRGVRGLLALDLPDYRNGDSVCCPSRIDKVRFRWTGSRYVVATDRVVPS
jgi:hypothetical protein